MTNRNDRPDGLFVLGATRVGSDQVEALLSRLGLRAGNVVDPLGSARRTLVEYNAWLASEALGGALHAPTAPPFQLLGHLDADLDEARRIFEKAFGPPSTADQGAAPWVWASPENCLLAPFWIAALGVVPGVVVVHQPPAEAAGLLVDERGVSPEAALELWSYLSRAGVAVCDQWEGLVLGTDRLVNAPGEALGDLAGYLADRQIVPSIEPVEEYEAARLLRGSRSTLASVASVEARYRGLSDVFGQLERSSVDRTGAGHIPAVVHELSKLYTPDYFESGFVPDTAPYRRDSAHWTSFFATVADRVVGLVQPETVLDAGCAIGLLVEALRDRGVDARGIDISPWAIDQVPTQTRPFCAIGSVTEEIEGHYDLITCLNVVEHLPPSMAEGVIENVCRHASAVLFSSTPEFFGDSTLLNVCSTGYWAELFACAGFSRDFELDPSFVSPAAALFRPRTLTTTQQATGYEHALWTAQKRVRAAELEGRDLASALSTAQQQLDEVEVALSEVARERDALTTSLQDLKLRRLAEAVAALDNVHAQELSQQQLLHDVAAAGRDRDQALAELQAMQRTKSYRYTQVLRRPYAWIRRRRSATSSAPMFGATAVPAPAPADTYARWVELYDTLDEVDRLHLREQVARLRDAPLLSVLLPVYNPAESFLRAAIESVRGQIYERWELCIADDGSTEPWVADVLGEYEELDDRIKIVRRPANGHISAATNSALALASGSWVMVLDHDDELSEHALALTAIALETHPGVGLLYSDEDKVDVDGTRHSAYFKPDFDPLLLMGQNYLAHLCVLRRDLVEQVGGYRLGFEGSQDWDLALRVSEQLSPDQVLHVPHVLYHWRVHPQSTASGLDAKPYAATAGRRAVIDHLERKGLKGDVVPVPMAGWNLVKWKLAEEPPLVSLIIPTRDGTLLQRCIDSVRFLTTYPNYEMLIVDNGSRGMPQLRYLRDHEEALQVVRDERDFNYSALNNAAVARARGEIICLLNDDTEVISPGWLEELVSQVLQPGVGAAGAKLYYSDGRVQHGGVLLGVSGLAIHAHRLSDRLSPGYFGRLILPQHFSAVTAACMVVRRNAWEQVGGLDEEHLPIAFNDVDFCLRLQEEGWGVVWTPSAELYHHESVSRGSELNDWDQHVSEIRYMKERWGHRLHADPAYNPNLGIADDGFKLAFPPRVTYR